MATNTKVSMIGSCVYELRPLEVNYRTDFDLQLAALDGEDAVTLSNKLSFLLYPMILKTSASYNDVMEIFVKQISIYFVTLEFLNMQGMRYPT
jgi:hypothetical protein